MVTKTCWALSVLIGTHASCVNCTEGSRTKAMKTEVAFVEIWELEIDQSYPLTIEPYEYHFSMH